MMQFVKRMQFVGQLSSDSLPGLDKSLEGDGRFYQPGASFVNLTYAQICA